MRHKLPRRYYGPWVVHTTRNIVLNLCSARRGMPVDNAPGRKGMVPEDYSVNNTRGNTMKRQVKGFVLQREGIISADQPMKTSVNIPRNAKVLDVIVDANGTFVLLCEVNSIQEGQAVEFKTKAFTILATNQDLENALTYRKTIQHGPAVFHIYDRQPSLKVL